MKSSYTTASRQRSIENHYVQFNNVEQLAIPPASIHGMGCVYAPIKLFGKIFSRGWLGCSFDAAKGGKSIVLVQYVDLRKSDVSHQFKLPLQ